MSGRKKDVATDNLIGTHNLFMEQFRRKGFLPDNLNDQETSTIAKKIKDLSENVLNRYQDPATKNSPWLDAWFSFNKGAGKASQVEVLVSDQNERDEQQQAVSLQAGL